MLTVTAKSVEPTELERLVDEDINAFEAWFMSHVEKTPLERSERAIIKTYLWHKTHPGQAPAQPGR